MTTSPVDPAEHTERAAYAAAQISLLDQLAAVGRKVFA